MVEFSSCHFERDVILWGVRWYVANPISYRQLEEMTEEVRIALSNQGARDAKTSINRRWRQRQLHYPAANALLTPRE
jgi:transposase-like protein